MRNHLIASVASVAFFAAAGAQAQVAGPVVGHIGANYARTDADVAGLDIDTDAFEVEGAAAFKLGTLGAQLDGSFADSDDITATFAGTAHLNTELSGARVGGFAGVIASDGDEVWGLGVEGQTNLAASTVLYGQAGYGDVDGSSADLWAVRAEVRHYVSETFKVTGSLGYLTVDDTGTDLDGWNAGVEAEYQFAGTPFSVFGGYQHAEIDAFDADADTLQVGVRFTFGGATLRGRDAAGAALAGVNTLFGLAD